MATVPVDDPLTTFNRRAETGKPNAARALVEAAASPEENHVAAVEMKVLDPV
jgi:hypothetical protein